MKTTLINTCWAIEEREWKLDKNLLKEREPMLGVATKTYIRDVKTRREIEAQLTDRVHANMSQGEGVNKKKELSEPWCKCSLIGKNS